MRTIPLMGVILCCGTTVASATTADEVQKTISAKITLADYSGWTHNIGTPGTELIVQKTGLVAGSPESLNKRTVIKNGQLFKAGGSELGGRFFQEGNAGHELKVGDRVYIYGLRALSAQGGVQIRVITVGTSDYVKDRRTKSLHGVADIEFVYDHLDGVDMNAVMADFGNWFRTEQEASESKTVKIGQTPAEVEAILGPPDKRIDLGAKKMYVYKDMKIVFVDGKVADVQ